MNPVTRILTFLKSFLGEVESEADRLTTEVEQFFTTAADKLERANTLFADEVAEIEDEIAELLDTVDARRVDRATVQSLVAKNTKRAKKLAEFLG